MTGNNITLNLLGLKCPMPVLKANKKGVYTHLSCYGNSNDYRIFFQR